jgi:beta-glucosidase
MTIAEKAGQMTQITLEVILEGGMFNIKRPHRFDQALFKDAITKYGVGSILNTPGIPLPTTEWLDLIRTIQETAIANTRLGLPILYGIDAVHGVNYTLNATLFPQQINMAASWNTELVEQAAAITASETRASGIPWNFSPVLDICKNPLWPRLWEGFGEDVHLATELGLAMVRGYQGTDIGNPHRVGACLKHFLGYGAPQSGKDRTPAWIPERFLREYFLPPFEAAIKAGAASIMINSGDINGIPVHASKYVLDTLLRKELGFKGLVVTDWEDIKYLHTRHRVAANQKEAVKLAIEAGVDMSMVPDDFSFTEYLIELVEEGSISEARLDASVMRILKFKQQLGLFENPVINPQVDYSSFAGPSHAEVALELARESITLLKNNHNQLPLSKASNVLVTGFSASEMRYLNGGWTGTWQGDVADKFITGKLTLLQAIHDKVGADRVQFVEGCTFDQLTSLQEAISAARDCDQIILCLGEMTYTEFHGNIDDLRLPQAQIDLAKALIATGKPITLVLLQGRPRIISDFADDIDSIIYAYLPGNEGGRAIADILFGDVNPSGKLPITYPKFVNSLVTYDHKYSEITSIQGSKTCYNPLFEFGTGLSYTSFEYADLQLNKNEVTKDEELKISVKVRNTGQRIGKEVVQLYLSDEYASVTPSVRRLKRFQKILLLPHEEKFVEFTLTKHDYSFVGLEDKWICESGTFMIKIGACSAKFTLL